jgi:hypothetical protein
MNEAFKQLLHGRKTFVVKRTMKLISHELKALIEKPGTDASNMFDEEISDPEFSDDEKEREYKLKKK